MSVEDDVDEMYRRSGGKRVLKCSHGYAPGKCPDGLCLNRRELKNVLLGLAGAVTAASDQAGAMTDAELGTLLTTGRWTTIEVHEAGRRLLAARSPSRTERSQS